MGGLFSHTMLKLKGKLGQEEIVGFAVIVIIVSIIIVFFLVFSLSNKTQVVSYEVSSFLQSSMQYTSSCQNNAGYLSVQKLVVSCYNGEKCQGGRDACSALNETLNGILGGSWQTGQDFPVKGYKLNISSDQGNLLSIQKGNITGSYKGAQQILPESGISLRVSFNEYN